MTAAAKAAALGASAISVTAVTAGRYALQVTAPSPPTSIWPVTVAGWIALVLSGATAIGLLYSLYRHSQKPIEKEIASVRKDLEQDIADARHDMTKELGRVCERQAQDFNHFRESITGQVNGFGRRVDKLDEDDEAQRTVIEGIMQGMVEVRTERRFITEKLDRMERMLERLTSTLPRGQGGR